MKGSLANCYTTRMLQLLLALLVILIYVSPALAQDVAIHYQVDKPSHVTVNITRPDGWVVRELIVDKEETAGPHEAVWDGRDNTGRILPPGDYQVRVLTHDPIKVKYITSVGNSGTPPWMTADGTGGWGGNHGNPLAVCSDATGVYMGWISSEICYPMIKRTPDGAKGLWGSKNFSPYAGPSLLALDGEFVYAYTPRDENLYKLKTSDGAIVKRVPVTTTWPGTSSEALVSDTNTITYNFSEEIAKSGVKGLAWGLCTTGGKLYISDPRNNRIQVLDTAGLNHVTDIKIHRPRGLAADGKGNLLVVTDGKVQKLNLATNAFTDFITHDLAAPFAISTAPDGNIYVSDLGTSQQIKLFSSQGKLLKSLGKAGGGTDYNLGKGGGEFDPTSFRAPCAVSAAADGSFWVAEDTQPKRIAHYTASGELLYQGFGSVNYAAITSINPADPSEVFSTMWGLFSGRVDEEKGTWKIGRILRPKWNPGGLGEADIGFTPIRSCLRNGKTYIWTGGGLFVVEPDHLKPVMYFNQSIPTKGALGELATDEFVRPQGWNTQVTLWQDENDDGAVQKEEVHFTPLPGARHGPQYFGARGMAPDFTLFCYGYSWKPRGWTPGGAPLYNRDDIVRSDSFNPINLTFQGESPDRDSSGNYYSVINRGVPNGLTFWSQRVGENYVVNYDPQWQPRWVVGKHATDIAKSGEMYFLWRIMGQLGDCMLVGDIEGFVHIIHKDGFYVQSILQDPNKDTTPSAELMRVESFSGATYENPKTGKRFLTISSNQASNVFEIQGTESVQVQPPQAIALAAPNVVTATDYTIRRVPPLARIGTQSVIPNQEIDWTKASNAIPLIQNNKLIGEVRMLYDDTNLYLKADILNPSAIQNNGMFSLKEGTIYLFTDQSSTCTNNSTVPDPTKLISLSARAAWKGDPGVYLNTPDGSAQQSMFLPHGKARAYVPIQQNGYAIEMSIPLSEAFTSPPKPGSKLAFNLASQGFGDNGMQFTPWQGTIGGDNNLPSKLACATFENVETPAPINQLVIDKTTVVPKIDGNPADWKAAANVVPIYAGARKIADFKLSYDEHNLYAYFVVQSPGPFRNTAANPEVVMLNGDAICLYLQKPEDKSSAQRIVLGKQGALPVVVLMRPLSSDRAPYSYSSPVSTVTFDYVARVTNCPFVAINGHKNYIAEVQLPWKTLGIIPQPGTTLRFDAQIIYGDPTGSGPLATYWWHTRGPEANEVMDAPSMVRLHPENWGELVLH